MGNFSAHHCPKCGRVGNKHCINAGHYKDCETHPGSFHSVRSECVKCVQARNRQEQEERAAARRAKEDKQEEEEEQGSPPKSGGKKKARAQKARPDSEKTMRQIRKEKKERRDSTGW